MKIRREHKLSFDIFRQSLRTAIKERLQNASNEDVHSLAADVRGDVIDPALNEIERRLSAAAQVFGKKAAVSVTLGSLATTCGLLYFPGDPISAVLGVAAAVGGVLNAAYKHIEDTRDVSLADMYFLWEVQKHGLKNHVD